MSLSLVRDMMFFYVFLPSQHSGRPQSTVRLTKNEVPDNHPKRVWVAQVLTVFIQLHGMSQNTIDPQDALLLLLRSPHAYNVDLSKALMVRDPSDTAIPLVIPLKKVAEFIANRNRME